MTEFRNEVYYDWSNDENVRKQKEAIAKVKEQLGKEYGNIVNGKEVFTDKKTLSFNPAYPDELIGKFQKAGKEGAEEAIQAADEAFKTWKRVPAEQRAQYLFNIAEEMRQRRMEINAWMILEAGKNFGEADADTCEAIDFMELYAREAIRYSQKQPLTPFPNEKNDYFYIPLGVGICIPPWNFPFAIMAGITAAAIVSGNTAVMKPSSDAPMMAWLFADMVHRAGVPAGVMNYLVASGSDAGDYMVDHPKTRFISFTGSMEVGLRITERAAKKNEGQIWIKRVIAEMGGKDSIIVDSEADLEEAVTGVMLAAFGFQGQKCSACSRAIVDEKIYDEFVEKLVAKTSQLQSGDPAENFYCGPVINEAAQNKTLEYVKIGSEEGKLVHGGKKIKDLPGFYLEPTIIKDIPPMARLSQEEVFGPLLAVIKAKDYDDALAIANNTEYGLTGAVFTLNEDKIRRAYEEFHVGNLYINRKCTGAMVDVHPFGGFNMSGTDSKAGSRDYLALFMQGKSVARNLNIKY